MSPHKRFRSPSPSSSYPSLSNTYNNDSDPAGSSKSLTGLKIQSFEADLCGDESLANQAESRCDQVEGGRLIRIGGTDQSSTENDEGVWVDRYDARLLLSPPPIDFEYPRIVTPPPPSPTGYSDLPSDHEEMFYFDDVERHQIAQKKLRRKRDDEQHKRIRLREEEERQREENIRLSKIPPAEQLTLMLRTLEALKSSPAPSLLEIRILANHGNDPRFASFLRKDGRYSAYWESMKSGNQQAEDNVNDPQDSAAPKNSLLGIADYGESSDESEADEEEDDDENKTSQAEAQNRPTGGFATAEEARPSTTPSGNTSAALSPAQSSSVHPVGHDGTGDSPDDSPDDIGVLDPEVLPSIQDDVINEPVDEPERLRRQARAKEWAERRRKAASANVCVHTQLSEPMDP